MTTQVSHAEQLRWTGIFGSVALLVLASLSLRDPTGVPFSLSLWAAGILLPLAFMAPAKPAEVSLPRWPVVAALGLLVVGTLARTWHLGAIPAYVHGDAGIVAMEAISVRDVDHRGFFAGPFTQGTEDFFGWFWIPNSCFYLQGIGMDLFGRDLVGFRIGSVILGVASLAGHTVLAWNLFGRYAALLSLIPLTTYHWHLFFSRSGHAYVQATFLAVWSLGLLALGLRRGSRRWLYLSGVVGGFSLFSVFAARVVPVILAAFALSEVLLHRQRWRELARSFGFVAWGAAAAIAPALPGLALNRSAFVGRGRDVFIWGDAREHVAAALGTDSLVGIAWSHFWLSLRIFLWGSDATEQYGFDGRYLDPFLVGFAVVGLFVCLRRSSGAAYRLLLLWFFVTFFLGSVLTIDAPAMSRLIPLVTAPYLFAAVGMISLLDALGSVYGGRFRRVLWGGAIALCVAGAWWNADRYFRVHAERRPADRVTLLAQRLGAEEPDVEVRMMLGPGSGVTPLYWDHGTIRFFNRHHRGQNVTDLESELATHSPPRIFVLHADRIDQLQRLQSAFPAGRVVDAQSLPGIVLFRAPVGRP